MEILCNAKLNLSLDLTGLREDGYHLIDSVMQSVDLYDYITVNPVNTGKITIRTNLSYLPTDERNLVHKAAALLSSKYSGKNNGLDITIKKIIPSQAGLAGGSSNAAGTLLALRQLWNLDLNDEELVELGLTLGADVPFCLTGGTARVRGIGEIIEPVKPLKNCFFVIVMPNKGVSTREAFKLIDEKENYKRPNTDSLIAAIDEGNTNLTADNLINVFNTAGICEFSPEIGDKLRSFGALGVSLTGSGAAGFGFFKDRKDADACLLEIRKNHRAWVARPVGYGIIIRKV